MGNVRAGSHPRSADSRAWALNAHGLRFSPVKWESQYFLLQRVIVSIKISSMLAYIKENRLFRIQQMLYKHDPASPLKKKDSILRCRWFEEIIQLSLKGKKQKAKTDGDQSILLHLHCDPSLSMLSETLTSVVPVLISSCRGTQPTRRHQVRRLGSFGHKQR